jgi:predicted acetyltransferase
VGIERDGRLDGYVTFSFRKGDTSLKNSLEVGELIYNEREALSELLAFLHRQFDQIDWLVINTLDEDFHIILSDPRNSSGNLVPHVYHESNTQGVGLMYRAIHVPALLTLLDSRQFADVTFNLKVTLEDSFFPANAGSINLQFEGGRPLKIGPDDHEVEIHLDVSEFSSMLMGVVRFKKLYDYGLAEISDPGFIPVVDELFRSEEKPVCLARF